MNGTLPPPPLPPPPPPLPAVIQYGRIQQVDTPETLCPPPRPTANPPPFWARRPRCRRSHRQRLSQPFPKSVLENPFPSRRPCAPQLSPHTPASVSALRRHDDRPAAAARLTRKGAAILEQFHLNCRHLILGREASPRPPPCVV
ncbi:hypothetical protein Ga0100230_022550 [Opitutaceae bacterium TAV3]|nr:hypothetical protein Ga0100230_022550 [Opitutaceae bacterium TAV3]